MASRISTSFLTTTMRQRALSPRLTRSFATNPARLSEKQSAETSFVRRVWADPQMRKVAIGGFIVLAGVEVYTWVKYGPRVWAYLKGDGKRE